MENNYTVYIHKNKINNKMYVGLTKQKPENRWGINGINYNNSPVFWNAIQKYGWDNFNHIIYRTKLTKEEAENLEIELIAKYKTQNRKYGYNILSGGHTFTIPEETRKKMSVAMMGNKNGLGKPCSEEKKKKISDAQKGRKFTEEHKKKISDAKKGVSTGPCSEEKRQHIIAAKKDKKKVLCVETGIIYESIQECARQLNLYATTICKVCKGKLHTTGGYHFEYYNA